MAASAITGVSGFGNWARLAAQQARDARHWGERARELAGRGEAARAARAQAAAGAAPLARWPM